MEDRIRQLEDHLRRDHPGHEEIAATMPADPVARVAALATVLGLDAAKAMRADFPLDALMAERENRRSLVSEADALFQAQGRPFALGAEER